MYLHFRQQSNDIEKLASHVRVPFRRVEGGQLPF